MEGKGLALTETVPLTISALAGGFGSGAGEDASERAGVCAAGGIVFGDGEEPTAETDGCEETDGELAFGTAVSGGFGADAVEARFIGGELPGVLVVEYVVLAGFGVDMLVTGGGVFFAAPLVALDEAEAGSTG